MRINQFVALASGLSRRAADKAIQDRQVLINGAPATLGQNVSDVDEVTLRGHKLSAISYKLVLLNKPVGYVCSRDGQGSQTIYELLPPELHNLKPVGRLDKDSSGLLLLTNDGQLAHELTHPKFAKEKVYEVELDKPLAPEDKAKIMQGIVLDDGLSSLRLTVNSKQQKTVNSKLSAVSYRVAMHEGRNRQIRRTFAALGYQVICLHRTQFGNYKLGDLKSGVFV